MQHSMLHTIYTLLSVPTQVPNDLLSSFQSAVPLITEIDPKSYASWQQQLTELAQQIDQAAQRQGLNHKTVVGFGGGFGAGKSRFINSLLGIDVLPEALEPCTAVPTYLTHSPQESTQACNLFGHQIELKTEQLGQLRHFVGSTDSINLGELIQHVHLGLPEMMWSNIALLDTPGYSKADSQHHGQNDENIALIQLSAAQHVVWLVNAKNGTVRDEDLQFLQKLALKNPIFVVLTQSDLVNRSDLKPIMDGISKHLASKNVAVAGIMAWAAPISQNRGERLAGDDILEWFEHVNQPVWQSYQDKLDLLMGRLIPAAQAEIATVGKQHQQMSGLLSLPELTAEQTKIMKRHVDEKATQKIQMSLAMTKLQEHHAEWSTCITELAIDGSLSVEGILQQNHSDEDVRFFYEMAKSHCQSTALSHSDKALSGYVKAASNGHAAALQALTTLANDSNPKACYWLAEIHLKSKINSRLKAANWYEKALVLGESLALSPARILANDSFRDLQYQIGLVYTQGKIVQLDPAEAAYWYEKAAKQEHILAQVAFADDFCQRLGDRTKALVWYQNAAHQWHIEAAYQAAGLHEYFNDLEQATHYMGMAAKYRHLPAYQWLEQHEASFLPAAYYLAQMYETGAGVNKSVDTAIKKYAVLVRQKHTDALERLLGLADERYLNAMLALADIAESYLKDIEQATKWHGMAVEYHDDQKALQWLYDQSRSGTQDAQDCLKSLADRLKRANLQYRYGLFSAYKNQNKVACDYMALAAVQKYNEAREFLEHHEGIFQLAAYYLAQMYEIGEGVNKSVDTAIKKYAVLVRQKHTDALERLLGLADERYLNAMLALADIAESDLKDLEQATKWHGMAVEFHDDQKSLQWLYDHSCSGLQDTQNCLKSLADRLKRASLQYHYGLFNVYRNQNKIACDYMALAAAQKHKEAYQWLKQQSAKDDSYAQSKMMWVFEEDKANPEDIDKIFYYYYLAIRRGDPKAFQTVSLHAKKIDIAKNLLATCYAFGYGVAVSYENAYEHYQKSDSIPNSYYNRVVMLYLGIGVKQDKKTAVLLLEQKKYLFSEQVMSFCNPFMLMSPVLVDFNSDKKYFEFNWNEFIKIATGIFFLIGLVYMFGDIGFLCSVFLSIFFLATRLWSVGAFSGQTTVANNQTGATLENGDLAQRNPYSHKANNDFDISNLTTSQAGTYYDPSTNLTWMRCSLGQTWNGKSCVGTAKMYTWDEAQQAVAKMNRNGGYAGYTDWVVPDHDALKTLLIKQKHMKDAPIYPVKGAQINHIIFPDTPEGLYWSASPDAQYDNYARYVHFGYSGSGSGYKNHNGHVRAVRAGR